MKGLTISPLMAGATALLMFAIWVPIPSLARVCASGAGYETPPGAKIDRSEFAAQLRDPVIMSKFAGRMGMEIGDATVGDLARLAFAETIFNRSAARDHEQLEKTIEGCTPKECYWPRDQQTAKRSTKPIFIEAISKVFSEGTNITHAATGNACCGVCFGDGYQTMAFKIDRKGDMELFGVEKKDFKWRPTFIPASRQVSP